MAKKVLTNTDTALLLDVSSGSATASEALSDTFRSVVESTAKDLSFALSRPFTTKRQVAGKDDAPTNRKS